MAEAYAYSGPSDTFTEIFGPWAENNDTLTGFLGLKFQIGGADHYGWARFSVYTLATANSEGDTAEISATLLDFAYEDCPGRAITAGDTGPGTPCATGVPFPPTLGLLALGAAGLGLWRLRRPRAA